MMIRKAIVVLMLLAIPVVGNAGGTFGGKNIDKPVVSSYQKLKLELIIMRNRIEQLVDYVDSELGFYKDERDKLMIENIKLTDKVKEQPREVVKEVTREVIPWWMYLVVVGALFI